jgi:RNA polymerase sigma factor (sigma-70 family)
MNDIELLGSFARNGSQDAFAQVVDRYVHLVYSAARRMLRDNHLAEDVTQQVFVLLARKAGTLRAGTIVPGWLYRTARNLASETARRERRRLRREQLAVEVMIETDSDDRWRQIEPQLDEAMADLRASDHDAIVLRYFENKSLKDVGEALGWSEDAAQKRVARALDRLRVSLLRRGVSVSLTALGVAVTGSAVQSAPAGLAVTAASTAVLSAGVSGVVPNYVSIMAPAKFKFIGAAVALGALSVALVAVWKENVALRRQAETLRINVASLTRHLEAGPGSNEVTTGGEALRKARLEHLEVLSLRGRVAQLSNELRQQHRPNDGSADATSDQPSEKSDSLLFTAALTNRVSSGHTLAIGGWTKEGMRGYLLATPTVQPGEAADDEPQIAMQSQVVSAPDSFWQQIGWGPYKSDTRQSTLAGVLPPEQVDALLEALRETAGADVSNDSSVTNRSGDRMAISWCMDDEKGAGVLMNIALYPRITPGGDSVDLELRPSTVSPGDVHSSLRQGK